VKDPDRLRFSIHLLTKALVHPRKIQPKSLFRSILTRKLFDFTTCAQIPAIFMKTRILRGRGEGTLLIFALGYTFPFAGS
jgi:hypothetical protein